MFNVPKWLAKFIIVKPIRDLMDRALTLVAPYDWVFKLVEFTMTMDPLYSLKYDASKFKAPYLVEHGGAGLCYMTSTTTCPDLSRLKNIQVPVQLVTGTADLFVFPTKTQALRNALPIGFDDHKMKGGGHCFLQNRAKETSKLALTFLKANSIL